MSSSFSLGALCHGLVFDINVSTVVRLPVTGRTPLGLAPSLVAQYEAPSLLGAAGSWEFHALSALFPFVNSLVPLFLFVSVIPNRHVGGPLFVAFGFAFHFPVLYCFGSLGVGPASMA